MRKPRELGVLMGTLARLSTVRRRPATCRAAAVLKDEVVADIAVHAPPSLEHLAGLRSVPKGFERSKWGTTCWKR